jgi:hypothetical protein
MWQIIAKCQKGLFKRSVDCTSDQPQVGNWKEIKIDRVDLLEARKGF